MNLKKNNVYPILLLGVVAIIVYYPVFFSTYAYTDELAGLWFFRGANEHTLIQHGRLVTEKLAVLLFGSIRSINELSFLRLFSFCGWLLSVPVWYLFLQKICVKEKLPEHLPFLATLYLICMPSVISSITWSACFEMFLGNTLGFLSGYVLFNAIKYEKERVDVSSKYLLLSVSLGVLSLFTYQNCFGCFLLPFLLHFLANNKLTKNISIGIAVYFFIFVVYYALYKYSLKAYAIPPSDRTAFNTDVLRKLLYFFAMPLKSSFLFTAIINEGSLVGYVIYVLIAIGFFILLIRQKGRNDTFTGIKMAGSLVLLFLLTYLPSLIAKENYASNRTLFALSMAVFLAVFSVILSALVKPKAVRGFSLLTAVILGSSACYNVRFQFLNPVVHEFAQVRHFLDSNYRSGIDTVYFIRPPEDFFEKKYNINRSWDEFGVPSTFFDWTPEFLTRQLVFERTKDKKNAEKIVVKSWLNKERFMAANPVFSKRVLLVNVEELLQ